jgi:hypothetical protein
MKIQKNKLQRIKKISKMFVFGMVLLSLFCLQGCAIFDAVKEVADMTKKVGSASRTIRDF